MFVRFRLTAMASDAAVVASIALQYGAPLDVIRRALMRDSRGRATGPARRGVGSTNRHDRRTTMDDPEVTLKKIQEVREIQELLRGFPPESVAKVLGLLKIDPDLTRQIMKMFDDADDYFGLCPTCHKCEGFINVGRSHWLYCTEHKVKWLIGANIFSSWRDETEAEQRAIYNEIGMGGFKEVQPYYHSSSRSGCDRVAAPAALIDDGTFPF
jgi:hypothetical protein